MDFTKEIDELLSDRKKFNETVYTPVMEAIKELETRWTDKKLDTIIKEYLKDDIPEVMKSGSKVVLFRQLATPNYELRRFLNVPDATGLDPLFLEYHDDKFTSNNPVKYYLGKIGLHYGIGKDNGHRIAYENIIDFNINDGKRIKDVKTVWGQALVDFHHELFKRAYPNLKSDFHDMSDWFHKNGGIAENYYKSVLALFVKHGILFENFLLEDKEELSFIEKIFLPAFYEVWKTIGKKPLIVALEPTETEEDIFWMCHPSETKHHIDNKKEKR